MDGYLCLPYLPTYLPFQQASKQAGKYSLTCKFAPFSRDSPFSHRQSPLLAYPFSILTSSRCIENPTIKPRSTTFAFLSPYHRSFNYLIPHPPPPPPPTLFFLLPKKKQKQNKR